MFKFYCPSCHFEFMADDVPHGAPLIVCECGDWIRAPRTACDEEQLIIDFFNEWTMEELTKE